MPRRPPPQMTALDRILASVAPQWALRRARARVALSAVRHYEAASTGRRTSQWQRNPLDQNSAARPALAALRELARDLKRNNGWAKRALGVIANNTVGWGILPRAVGDDDAAEQATELWNAWADSTACDADGRLPLYGLQRLAMECIVESGEVLILKRVRPEGGAIPLQIQVLEPDYIDIYHDAAKGPSGGPVIQGVEFDSAGRRVAYYLYDQHPGAIRVFRRSESRRVPAENVIHCYRVERPGQVRGVSWLAAAILKLRDFDEWEDASLMRQKIAACFAAFVTDDGSGTMVGDKDDRIPPDPLAEMLEPGLISYLPPGREITFAAPPSESGQDGFSNTILHRLAAALDVTFEDLSTDYSQVNFSSARLARLAHWQSVHNWRWNMFIPVACDGIWTWAMETAVAGGLLREARRATWTPPSMPMIEPDKEGLAYKRLVRAGVMTLAEAIRERGGDPRTHLDEIAAMNAALDERGIWLDSDPRKTSDAGLTQERAGGGSGGDPVPTVSTEASNGVNGVHAH